MAGTRNRKTGVPVMRITARLDHLAIPRLLHHYKSHGNPAVFIESPHEQQHHEGRKSGEERYRATPYRDPWPDRA
jgi:hypothetical protein